MSDQMMSKATKAEKPTVDEQRAQMAAALEEQMAHMNRLVTGHHLLMPCIHQMQGEGLTLREIVGVLRGASEHLFEATDRRGALRLDDDDSEIPF